jgi:hypothetical protein
MEANEFVKLSQHRTGHLEIWVTKYAMCIGAKAISCIEVRSLEVQPLMLLLY